MLYEYIRAFYFNGTTITDLSLDNQSEVDNMSLSLSSSKYLYIGQYFPFNNLFLYMNTVNTTASSMVIEYWTGKEWIPAVDLLDGTKLLGATMGKSGVVQFAPNRRSSWAKVDDTTSNGAPTQLSSLNVYDCYWIRISTSVAITPVVKELSYCFTTTERLNNLDIEIDGFYDSFSVGKTDWINEILTASKLVLSDLKRMGLVVHQGQVLRFDDVSIPCDYKTLDLIYTNLGSSYNEKRTDVRARYTEVIGSRAFTFDTDGDGQVSAKEISSRAREMLR